MLRDTLLDPLANKHFIVGPKKWQEWQQKFANKA